jgi:uncharacterized protein YkwD
MKPIGDSSVFPWNACLQEEKMKKLLAPAAAALAVVLAAIALFAAQAGNTSAAPSLDSEEQALFSLVNSYRAQNGKPAYVLNTDLNESADWHSNDMGTNNYFGHIDSLGRNASERMCAFGYCYSTWKGESIAGGFPTAAEVLNAWQLAPSYNNLLLNNSFKVVGIGRNQVAGSSHGWYWTMDFAGQIPDGSTPTPSPSPTPAPTPTQPPGCTNDADCDTWSDSLEGYVGTDRFDSCNNTTSRNDEHPDAWPADINDDRVVNTLDAGSLVFVLNSRQGDGDFTQRLDLNSDGVINTLDAGRLVFSLNDSC